MSENQKFLAEVESGELPIALFNHSAHIRLAWIYLSQWPLPEAMILFRDTLKIFATRHGKAEIYNETITFAFLILIHEGMQRSAGSGGSWERFAEMNQPLITQGRQILLKWYREPLLSSAVAKRTFRLPDRFEIILN